MSATIPIDTKEHILNVAERLYAKNGFAGTSLRSVIREADVNLSAVHYHFGSKEELFRAVIARVAEPIVKGQLARLAECEAENENPSVEEVLETFIAPPLEIVLNLGDRSIDCARFIGRCRSEPDSIRDIAEQEFKGSKKAFLDAMARSLPDFSRNELAWKLDLVITVLRRVMTEVGKPNALIKDTTPEAIANAVSKLVCFLAPGLHC